MCYRREDKDLVRSGKDHTPDTCNDKGDGLYEKGVVKRTYRVRVENLESSFSRKVSLEVTGE